MLCCRCMCAPRGALFESDTVGLGAPGDISLSDVDELPLKAPPVPGVVAYCSSVDQPLRGNPVQEGRLWYLSADRAELVTMSLYVNGLSFEHEEGEVSISLSPFCLVRTCKLQNPGVNPETQPFGNLKIFKLSLFTHGMTFFFGVDTGAESTVGSSGDIQARDGADAEDARLQWVNDISRVVQSVTRSLFRPYTIAVDPLDMVSSTQRRLLAGYLLHHETNGPITVSYCELHAHSDGHAMLWFYENDLCQVPIMDVCVGANTSCCERIGVNCSCFCIEEHHFAARTLMERRLWLRAVSNVKVKLRHRAPSPTSDDMRHFRNAIKEHISALSAKMGEGHIATDALLTRCISRAGAVGFSRGAAAAEVPEKSSGFSPAATVLPAKACAAVAFDGDEAGGAVRAAESTCPDAKWERYSEKAKPSEVPTQARIVGPKASSTLGCAASMASQPLRMPSLEGDSEGTADDGAGAVCTQVFSSGPLNAECEGERRGCAAAAAVEAAIAATADAAAATAAATAAAATVAAVPEGDRDAVAAVSNPKPSSFSSASCFGTGVVRVLLVVGAGVDCRNAKTSLDCAFRIEAWCNRCGIKDVTFLNVAESDDEASHPRELREGVRALCRRCCPGDTVVLHVTNFKVPSLEDMIALCAATAAAGESGGGCVLAALPKFATAVCIVDSPRIAEILGLEDAAMDRLESIRVVRFEVTTDSLAASMTADLCSVAMLRASDALSLVDGPCKLTCGDFFAEMAEQVHDLAAASAESPPQVFLRAHPDYQTADAVMWPIVAAPRNQAGSGSREWAGRIVPCEQPAPKKHAPSTLSYLSCEEVHGPHLNRALPVVPEQMPVNVAEIAVPMQTLQTRGGGCSGGVHHHGRRRHSASGHDGRRRRSSDGRGGHLKLRQSGSGRSMPANVGSLSMLLTGGGLGNTSLSPYSSPPSSGTAAWTGTDGKMPLASATQTVSQASSALNSSISAWSTSLQVEASTSSSDWQTLPVSTSLGISGNSDSTAGMVSTSRHTASDSRFGRGGARDRGSEGLFGGSGGTSI
eukprot:TRINITY_DN43967_c0_g1_i1.p1 TRINITY_DN43967_c0_g1~~TRINITY_DN43967_c0_g1_i1.p1  ORF type:complete len:1039 (-),score=147.87 TRINITY_DN43967_c0_g1_i1:33-3149(-)